MVEIDEELGLPAFTCDKELNMKGRVRFVNADHTELPTDIFSYVALDTEEYDKWWRKNQPQTYIPRDLDDLFTSAFLLDPFVQLTKSANKINKLMDVYLNNNSIDITCPVLAEHRCTIWQGRHRFWLARHLNVPFVVAAASCKAATQLASHGLLYNVQSKSSKLFDRRRDFK